jgi:uncharacterized membrane protein YhaH (DUF805 family)
MGFLLLALTKKALGDPDWFELVTLIFSIGVWFVLLLATAQRLHDLDKSAWWILVCMIPHGTLCVVLVGVLKKGTRGNNTYGPPDFRELNIQP